MLLGRAFQRELRLSPKGLSPAMAGAFQLASTRKVILRTPYLTGLGSECSYLTTPFKHMDLDPSACSSDCSELHTQSKWFRLLPFRSPLLRELFLFLRLLRCFNSPGNHLMALCIQAKDFRSSIGKVSPFGNSRVKGCLPPHRDLSQAATSFIVFLCQGIHHILLT